MTRDSVNAEREDYSRGRDEPTSQAAFAKACLTISRHHERILRAIHESTGGLTLKEYADMVGLQLNAVSGRFSELKYLELICRTGERKYGCGVWSLTQKGEDIIGRMT